MVRTPPAPLWPGREMIEGAGRNLYGVDLLATI
jgi:hypothetical protein